MDVDPGDVNPWMLTHEASDVDSCCIFQGSLFRYTADMETSDDSTHAIHIRDTVTSHVVIIPLVNAANNVPELDYMVDPILEV